MQLESITDINVTNICTTIYYSLTLVTESDKTYSWQLTFLSYTEHSFAINIKSLISTKLNTQEMKEIGLKLKNVWNF